MNYIAINTMRKVWNGFLLIMMCASLAGCGKSADLELKSIGEPGLGEEMFPEEDVSSKETEAEETETETEPVLIKVFVCGAVAKEGVYELPEGSRVFDAVRAAGGFAEDADETYVNQADYVSDAQKLYIPTESEAGELKEQAAALQENVSGEGGGLVNINTADENALMSLPGIGQTRARSIIDYRTQNGPFEKAEDLMNVSGIGQAGFDRLKMYITVK